MQGEATYWLLQFLALLATTYNRDDLLWVAFLRDNSVVSRPDDFRALLVQRFAPSRALLPSLSSFVSVNELPPVTFTC